MARAKKKISEIDKLENPKNNAADFGVGREIPIENVDAIVNMNLLDNDQLLRYSRKIGSYYVSIVENIAGKGELNNESLNGLPDGLKDKMEGYAQCIKKNRELQHVRFDLKDNAARELISEIAKKKGLENDLAEETAKKYELEEISRGIFAMYMDKDLFTKINGEKAAVATVNKKGICFVSLPRECKVGVGRDYLFVENLLHEFHHIVWSFFVNDNKIVCNEENDGVRFCYSFIQDEIIAKLASGGGMACHTSISFMDKKSLENFRFSYPGKEKEVNEKLSELNRMMCDQLIPFMQESGVDKQDLIFPVMEAHNFKELGYNLRKFNLALEAKMIEKKRNENLEENRNWEKA